MATKRKSSRTTIKKVSEPVATVEKVSEPVAINEKMLDRLEKDPVKLRKSIESRKDISESVKLEIMKRIDIDKMRVVGEESEKKNSARHSMKDIPAGLKDNERYQIARINANPDLSDAEKAGMIEAVKKNTKAVLKQIK